jgi:hypothetical protein
MMFSRIRKRLTYANVAMTLALVFAMSGGAYAAKHYLITSTKQISPKVLKALEGKAGPAGPEGKAGPAGPLGPLGKEGPSGKEGKEGPLGKEGKEGPLGKEGKLGKEGSPWTAGGTLPAGSSEHGVWSIRQVGSALTPVVQTAISFPIALASELDAAHTHYIKPAEAAPSGCLSGTPAKPEAESGNLCVYAKTEFKLGKAVIESIEGTGGAGGSGSTIKFEEENTELLFAQGDWIVTG